MVGSETAEAYSAAKYLMFSEEIEAPNTVERWAEKIEYLLLEPSTLSELRPQVAAFARQHWCWSRCAEQYYQIFQEITDSKRADILCLPSSVD
jgi:glycosyltransferase involved in cell wall biosynthesis